MPDSALLVFPSQPLQGLCSSQLLKSWCVKVINVFGEGMYYQSYGQIGLTPEKPQVAPLDPQNTKVPVYYPFTFIRP